jgi:hypothetical protein
VTATVTDSNVYTPGESSWRMEVTPNGNGSVVRMVWVRGFKRNATARFLSVLYRLGGRRLFKPEAKKVLRNLERSS